MILKYGTAVWKPPLPVSAAICLASRLLNSDIGRLLRTLSSRGPGHRPFTAVTRVRIPLGSLPSCRLGKPRLHNIFA